MTNEVIKANEWDYEKSVLEVKPLVASYRKLTIDLIRKLYFAQQALSSPGYRSDLTSCHDAQGPKSFEGYLLDVGIPKRTAYNWLFLYDVDNDRLLEPDDARARRDQMLEQMFKEIQTHAKKNPAWRPEGWTAPLERAYQKWLNELKVLNSIEQKGFEQAEMFSREYLRILAQQMQEDPSPEEMLYQEELCIKYEHVVTPLVRVEQQISIARIVEKSIVMFPAEARAAVARSVAKIVMDMSDNMEGGK